MRRAARALAAVLTVANSGCATHDEYRRAFDESRALHQNSHTVALPPTEARQAVISTLIKNGFNVAQAQADLVTATRTIKDTQDEELSYVVTATAAIAVQDGAHTVVSLSANQQTVLHRKTHDWFHLLWVVPLFPYASEYQTVMRSESTVDDPKFYGSFFSALDKLAATPIPAGADRATAAAQSATNASARRK